MNAYIIEASDFSGNVNSRRSSLDEARAPTQQIVASFHSFDVIVPEGEVYVSSPPPTGLFFGRTIVFYEVSAILTILEVVPWRLLEPAVLEKAGVIDGEEVVDDAILEGVTLPFLEAAWLKGSGLVISEEGVGDITLLRRFLPNLTLEALRPEPLDLMRISGLARFKESAAIFDLHLTKAGADLSKIEEGLRRLVRIRVNDREQGVHDEPGSDH